MSIVDAAILLKSLKSLPAETEWVEFKENYFDAEDVGKYISALANSAMFHDQRHGYLVYGVKDESHELVGTQIRLKTKTVGNEPFESWLNRMINPQLNLEFASFDIDGKHFEIICINPAYLSPVRFKTEAYIRIDTTTQPLRNYPERERTLWAITSRYNFEQNIVSNHLSEDEMFNQFHIKEFLDGIGSPRESKEGMLDQLIAEDLIYFDKQNGYDVTNVFALLAAKDLSIFPALARKAVRVITYKGKDKLQGEDDVTGKRGYGLHFKKLLRYIMDRIEHREEIIHGVRKTLHDIPEVSVRELAVNALIHQDLMVRGGGPVIEIFKDKIKITNPGKPLVDPKRFIDAPARSRNERLASYMRRLGLCEERGSGVDRALQEIEMRALPAPLFFEVSDSTVVTVFGPRPFAVMDKDDRIRACYQHAALKFEASDPMSNSTLRKRFGLSDKQYPQVSRVIADTIEAGLIRPLSEDQSNKSAKYVPFWA